MADTLLCIDTSTNLGSVCLRHKGITESIDISKPNAQAAELVPAIESLLKALGIWYGDLDALATTIGPGSFTGLRIGLAAARTIAFMHPRLTLYPYTTLECLAAGYTGEESRLCATLKAGKGEIYQQFFERENTSIQAASPIAIVNPSSFTRPEQGAILGNTNELTQWEHYSAPDYPHARDLLRAVNSIAPTESRALKPLYIRPPDAKLPGEDSTPS